ncbi:coproporphyrinogen III oxidase family protein [Leptotrichia sp. OH3620_COT-345]|uniref:coproporphyrinogen-III oxidase family protein n=1 Tax=Leptotrichia sp. OH3620_COT-345 TaxID=2491048 RepID=UPI000F6459E7|nr:coproporphyrinogen-III oxidase family protein [Leptotrichia sp. OH3620_COT-345]RRD40415.1 coproporphyrinogen III oxidase family protein [Leptotrichia sp. OH3620_COT-345]
MFNERLKSHHDVGNIIGQHFGRMKRPVSSEEVEKILSKKAKEEIGGMYVHIPYCDKICSFCNLNRKQLDNDLEDYTAFLIGEFEKYGKTNYMQSKKLDVLFFGGGTPTILREHQLEKIFKSIRKNFRFTDNYEFTFETTLHNLTSKKIEILQENGVNRLSIGIQSFSPKGRDTLNRTYGKEETVKRLRKLKEIFNGLVCIDIIYNYPEQTVEEVTEDAAIIAELKIDSASFYSLMIQEGSKMSKDISDNTLQLNYKLETDKKLHDAFMEYLLSTGEYEILEYTKIVRKNRDKYKYIKHLNAGYDLLPIGIGAGGKLDNIDMFRMNYERQFFMMSSEEERKLKILSGLFQYPKVYFSDIKKYISEEVFKKIYELFKIYEEKKYLKLYDEHYEITPNGIFWGNNIDSEIIKLCLGGK